MATPRWTLALLGPPFLLGDGEPRRLERRTAALLAYVALEGPQPRARMAGLLWPDSPPKTARANLRQLVHRLRDLAGGDLLSAADPLALAPDAEVDVVGLRRRAIGAPDALPTGALLAGLDLDDTLELGDWLARARAAVDHARVDATLADAERLAGDGDVAAAIACVDRALAIDPASEPAYRRLMRLHYAAGDPAAAAAAFTRCRVALRERGLDPSPHTVELADEIARHRHPARRAVAVEPTLPVTVERPPVLVGRAREWAAMQRAWQAQQAIVLGGPPGIGKTRLMREFLDAHARPLYFQGRPGDGAVPYGTHARTYRELLDTTGDADLPAWARRELARIVAGLGEPPPPIADPAEQVRFWAAKVEAHRLASARGFDALGFDDMQYVDPASLQAGTYVLAQLRTDAATPVRTIHCYRTGELADDVLATIRQVAAAGHLLHLELEPLAADDARELVRTLEVPGLDAIAGEVARYAGGSPLFVLETARHLIESGELARGFPDRLPPPERIGAIVGHRLDRLPAAALHLARAIAVLGTDFSLALAAAVVDAPVEAVIEAWTALEHAQLVGERGLAHDVVAETVLAGMAAPVRALLHRRAAEALDAAGAAPGRVAAHWRAAGDDRRAADVRPRAEAAARRTLLPNDAARYYQP